MYAYSLFCLPTQLHLRFKSIISLLYLYVCAREFLYISFYVKICFHFFGMFQEWAEKGTLCQGRDAKLTVKMCSLPLNQSLDNLCKCSGDEAIDKKYGSCINTIKTPSELYFRYLFNVTKFNHSLCICNFFSSDVITFISYLLLLLLSFDK